VFWLFGLSGAGKSTLANRLTGQLRGEGRGVLALDGDVLRSGLCRELGFSDDDRAENLRRAAEAARLGIESGLSVVASFITPLEKNRAMIRTILGPDRLVLIFVDAPLGVCQARDVKGLYARAHSGELRQMTGVSSGFERPEAPDLALETDRENADASLRRLLAFVGPRLPVIRPR
jgi:adenylyl-sulfate kinase